MCFVQTHPCSDVAGNRYWTCFAKATSYWKSKPSNCPRTAWGNSYDLYFKCKNNNHFNFRSKKLVRRAWLSDVAHLCHSGRERRQTWGSMASALPRQHSVCSEKAGWCRQKIVACLSGKQQMLPAIKPSASAAAWWCALRGFRMEKNRILALIIKVYIKGMISMSPDFCTFPYTEKYKIHSLQVPAFL